MTAVISRTRSTWSAHPPALREVAIAFGWTLVLPAIVGALFLITVKVAGWSVGVIPWVLPVAVAPGAVGMAAWVSRRDPRGRDLGFTRPTRSLWHLLWEAPLAIVGSAAVAAGVGALFGISPSAATSSASGPGSGPLLTAALLLTTVVVVPVMEEITFRRLLLGWLGARMTTIAAVLASGVLFGLVHIAPPVICFVLPLGIALAAIRVWHDSLWASLIVHAANNLLVTLLLVEALR